MSRVGSNIVIGTFWIGIAGWMYFTGGAENQAGAAILAVLGVMFYWAAFKIYKNPNLVKKNKRSLIQQMTDPNTKKSMKKKK